MCQLRFYCAAVCRKLGNESVLDLQASVRRWNANKRCKDVWYKFPIECENVTQGCMWQISAWQRKSVRSHFADLCFTSNRGRSWYAKSEKGRASLAATRSFHVGNGSDQGCALNMAQHDATLLNTTQNHKTSPTVLSWASSCPPKLPLGPQLEPNLALLRPNWSSRTSHVSVSETQKV